jgi:hypothetical protein
MGESKILQGLERGCCQFSLDPELNRMLDYHGKMRRVADDRYRESRFLSKDLY